MPLILSGSVNISGSMTATTILVSSPGGGGMVSSSQQIQNYNLFAVTSSANTFYGNQTINGNVTLRSGNSAVFYRTDNGIYTELYDSGSGASNGFVLNNTNGEGFHFKNAAASIMRLDSANNIGMGTNTPDFGSFGAGEKILGISNVGARARVQFQNTSTGTSGVAGTLAFFNGSNQLGSIDVIADGATNKGYYSFNTHDGSSNAQRVKIDSATLSSNVPINTNNNTIYSSYSTPANVNSGNTTVYTYNQTSGEYCVGFEYSLFSLYAPSGTNLFGLAHGFAYFMADGSTNASYKSATAENGWSVAVAATNGGTFTITFTAGGGATHTNINLRVRKINRTGAG